ncbi:hypothetical protein AALP_AAs49363U000200 [Arabis alpina]|uniref:Uncharacterized protein n=1 Tax=Arabis alpina TaxID=50452 RepID=A0A087G1H7_ARAAL|nr:hypothetical protein AALP_AAs49363U000200 [Arabis alpina]
MCFQRCLSLIVVSPVSQSDSSVSIAGHRTGTGDVLALTSMPIPAISPWIQILNSQIFLIHPPSGLKPYVSVVPFPLRQRSISVNRNLYPGIPDVSGTPLSCSPMKYIRRFLSKIHVSIFRDGLLLGVGLWEIILGFSKPNSWWPTLRIILPNGCLLPTESKIRICTNFTFF